MRPMQPAISPPPYAPPAEGVGRNMLLLVQLRWLAVGGQLATILVVDGLLGIRLPLGPMASVLAALVLLNLVTLARRSRWSDTNLPLFAALVLDVAALTAQLYLSGGARNPFVSLYLLQVVIGAILLKVWSSWALVAMTGLIAAAVTFWMWREEKGADRLALGLVLGGAIGNIVERVRFGYVVDFADLHFGEWRPFLVFNVADAAITIGVLILLARALLIRDKPAAKPDKMASENVNA